MGLGVRFDPRVIEAPVGVLGDLLDELVGALTKSAKGGEGDRLEVDVQALLGELCAERLTRPNSSPTNLHTKCPRENRGVSIFAPRQRKDGQLVSASSDEFWAFMISISRPQGFQPPHAKALRTYVTAKVADSVTIQSATHCSLRCL